MHHVGIALDLHVAGDAHLAGLRYPAHIVAAQVDQHQVLGDLLGVGEQLFFQLLVALRRGAAFAGAGDGPHRDLVVLHPGEDLRRGAGDVEVLQVQIEHIRGRVQIAQRPVEVDGRGGEIAAHALGRHHLHDVAGENVLADLLHGGGVLLAGKLGDEVVFVHRRAVHLVLRFRQRRAQAALQLVQTGFGAGHRVRGVGAHVHDQEQAAAQVIEHHHFLGAHQQDVRHPQHVLATRRAQPGLEIAHAVVAEIAHQAAVEAGQPGHVRGPVLETVVFDPADRVVAVELLDDGAVGIAHGDARAGDAHHLAGRQADDRIAAPALAALHRFEQVAVGPGGQLAVGGQRRVQIRQHFAHDRYAAITLAGVIVQIAW